MDRRHFIKTTGALAAYQLVRPATLRAAEVATNLPISELIRALGQDGSLVLVPTDVAYVAHQTSFNKRTELTPQVRVLPTSAEAVSKTILWARSAQVPFAIRGGGHSYEGFSQSTGLVIDTRQMNSLHFDPNSQNLEVGGGVTLGAVYEYLAQFGRAIPAGSCPTVGVSGHTLGGGFGLLARKFGLACDSVLEFEMVDAQGEILNISATENAELFWALRGGGNGNFGIVTRFVFETHAVQDVAVFGVKWQLAPPQALKLFKTWQDWAPEAPENITTSFHMNRGPQGTIALHCAGLTVGPTSELELELRALTQAAQPLSQSTTPMPFIQSVHHFAGSDESVFMKAKSDYLNAPMSDQGINHFFQQLQSHPANIAAIFDSWRNDSPKN